MKQAPERATDLMNEALLEELFTPLQQRNAGELVADRLVTAIAMGAFVAGQRLPPERELAATLDVSRTTVREAISRLAAAGYVEVRRGRNGGAIVSTETGPQTDEMVRRTLAPGWEQLERLFDFRTMIEPLIARTAAERCSAEDAERIAAALTDYQLAGDDRRASGQADGALHQAIVEAAANPYLTALSDRIRRTVSLGFHAEPYSVAIRRRALVEHAELASAITSGDPERAAQVAARHFAITEDRLREIYARSSSLDGTMGELP